MKYELASNVSFLKPFLKGVGKIVPLAKLIRIKGYKVATGLEEQKHAGIIKYIADNKYVITLRIQSLVDKGRSHRYDTLEKILVDLSHELAHLKEWDHTPKHFKYQARIMLHFAKKLRKTGIKDHSIKTNRIRSKNDVK
jgi:hypothetical protein